MATEDKRRWFLAVGKTKTGPYTFAELQLLFHSGQLATNSMLLFETGTKWCPAATVPGLCLPPSPNPKDHLTAQISTSDKDRSEPMGDSFLVSLWKVLNSSDLKSTMTTSHPGVKLFFASIAGSAFLFAAIFVVGNIINPSSTVQPRASTPKDEKQLQLTTQKRDVLPIIEADQSTLRGIEFARWEVDGFIIRGQIKNNTNLDIAPNSISYVVYGPNNLKLYEGSLFFPSLGRGQSGLCQIMPPPGLMIDRVFIGPIDPKAPASKNVWHERTQFKTNPNDDLPPLSDPDVMRLIQPMKDAGTYTPEAGRAMQNYVRTVRRRASAP